MSDVVKEFYLSFLAAWQKLFCINLPERWYPRSMQPDAAYPSRVRTMLPVAGLIPGLLAVIAVRFVSWLTNPGGAILFAAFLIPPVWECLTKWAGLRATGYCVHLFRNGLSASEIMNAEWNLDDFREADAVSQIILFSLYLLQMSLCGLLVYYGKSVWFIYAWIGCTFLQAGLSRYSTDDDGMPLINESASGERWFFVSSAILFFIFGLFSGTLSAAVWCYLGSWVLQYLFLNLAGDSESGISPVKLAFFGDCARILLMILGLALFR